MSNDASIVLRKAQEVLERDGWCQGNLFTEDGRHCALGALLAAANDLCQGDSLAWTERWGDAAQLARRALEERIPLVARWNDDPETRMPDVVKFFGEVADEEEFRS